MISGRRSVRVKSSEAAADTTDRVTLTQVEKTGVCLLVRMRIGCEANSFLRGVHVNHATTHEIPLELRSVGVPRS